MSGEKELTISDVVKELFEEPSRPSVYDAVGDWEYEAKKSKKRVLPKGIKYAIITEDNKVMLHFEGNSLDPDTLEDTAESLGYDISFCNDPKYEGKDRIDILSFRTAVISYNSEIWLNVLEAYRKKAYK